MSGPLKHALQIVPIPTISQRLFPEARQKSMPMITTVISLHILYYPADKICSIPYTDHINNSSRSDVFPYCEKNNRKYGGIHNELPCAKTHMQKAADPQIHAGKGIYAKITQPVTADADADKQDACQHHNRPPANGCFFYLHLLCLLRSCFQEKDPGLKIAQSFASRDFPAGCIRCNKTNVHQLISVIIPIWLILLPVDCDII